jgi:hypothetical protein
MPWVITICAIIFALIALATRLPISAPATPPDSPAVQPTPPAAATKPTTSDVSAQTEITELRRILNDAQSALADRDREIANAQAELVALQSSRPSATALEAVSLASALQVLQRSLQAHGATTYLLANATGPVALLVLDQQGSGSLLLPTALPALPPDQRYGLWLTSEQQMPRLLTTCTSGLNTFTLPPPFTSLGTFSLRHDQVPTIPGDIYASSSWPDSPQQ